MEQDTAEKPDAPPVTKTDAPPTEHPSGHNRYLVKWRLEMAMQANGMNRTYHGWIGEISMQNATAYIENNLPVNAKLTAVFAIPPRVAHEPPKMIQASCQSVYCVLGNNGMFRAGIQFVSFMGNGSKELAKELANHIATHG